MSTSMGSIERHMKVELCKSTSKRYVAIERSGYIREGYRCTCLGRYSV